ncbi:MAG TPA: phosphoribosylformylglycinamidine synthase subunit PurS [Candidatus Eisenbacteria bacterium]|nr:phosphoribosylformylglycinamidine synthase subunit PurS [Candidatus Eisenbacteria bacterium]
MKYDLRIEVRLKPGHSDPEGETTADLLKELGFNVEKCMVSKVYNLVVQAKTRKSVLEQAEEMCRKLLANPTKDDYRISVEVKK